MSSVASLLSIYMLASNPSSQDFCQAEAVKHTARQPAIKITQVQVHNIISLKSMGYQDF